MAMIKRSKKWTLMHELTVQTIVYPGAFVKSAHIILSQTGLMTISPGFQFDGATFLPDSFKKLMLAAIVHDALYALMRRNDMTHDLQDQADDCFFMLCVENGVPRWRAKIYRSMLRRFGHYALRRSDKKLRFINTAEG